MTIEWRLARRSRWNLETDCNEWFGYRSPDGYGRILFKGGIRMTHRVAYEVLVGPISKGLTIDHLCRNRACINPTHLEPVPFRINVLRGNNHAAQNARKTHCYKGHEFTPENTIIRRDRRNPSRMCRTCKEASWTFHNRRRAAMKLQVTGR